MQQVEITRKVVRQTSREETDECFVVLIAAPIHASYSSDLLVFKPENPSQKYIIVLDNLPLLSKAINVLCTPSEDQR